MSSDLWVLVILATVSTVAWMWGYLRGHEVADAVWRRRFREQKSLLLDALRRVAAFEEAARDRHERCRLTPDEHERFIQIAEREDDQ